MLSENALSRAVVLHRAAAAAQDCVGGSERESSSAVDGCPNQISMTTLSPGCATPQIASLLLELRSHCVAAAATPSTATSPASTAAALSAEQPPALWTQPIFITGDVTPDGLVIPTLEAVGFYLMALDPPLVLQEQEQEQEEEHDDGGGETEGLERVTFVLETNSLQRWYGSEQAASLAKAVKAEETARSHVHDSRL